MKVALPHEHGPSTSTPPSDFRVVSGEIRCELGEGPLWEEQTGRLYWVDILAGAVHRLTVESGSLCSWQLPESIGWLIPRQDRTTFIAGLRTGFSELSLEPLSIRQLARFPSHLRNERLRMNDGKADSRGRIFAGTMDMDGQQRGDLYRLDSERSWTIVDTGYGIPNGPAFSPAGDILYHADSRLRVVHEFQIRSDGTLADKRPLLEFAQDWGMPDGMTTDADGALWIAHWGGSRVSRFTPAGILDRTIYLPTPQITSCVFGGRDFRTMYVTSAALGRPEDPLAGAVFAIDPGCQGLPSHAFSGQRMSREREAHE